MADLLLPNRDYIIVPLLLNYYLICLTRCHRLINRASMAMEENV